MSSHPCLSTLLPNPPNKFCTLDAMELLNILELGESRDSHSQSHGEWRIPFVIKYLAIIWYFPKELNITYGC
jgi:hypothetical protein